MGEDSSPRWLVASESTFHQTVSSVPSVPRGGCPAYGKRQLAALAGRLYRYMVQSFRPGISARSTSSALVCAPFGLVRRLPPAAVQRGRAQLALCVPGSPVQIGALSVSLAAWLPLRRHLVQRKGFSAWGGSLLRRVRLPHPSGESFDLRKLQPNDSPPVASAAGLRRSQGGLAACRLGPLLPSVNHSTSAGSGRMILLRSFLRPGLRGLALFRSALRAPVICSPVLLRRPEEQITEARWSLRSNPFGGFSFFQVASLPQVNGSLRSVLCSG